MSTRAIVGIMNEKNGNIIGGWQWNDGGNLGYQLRNNFKTKEDVMELVQQGVWSSLFTPRDTSLKEWQDVCAKRPNEYQLIPVKNCYVLKQPHHLTENFVQGREVVTYGTALLFKNIAVAFGQDINYVYLFNPKTGKWKTFGQRYSYDYLKKFCDSTPVNQHSKLLE